MTQVEGKQALYDRLKRLPESVLVAVAQEMEKRADVIVKTARSLSPKETGRVAASIGWTWGEAPKGAMTIASVRGRGGGEYGTMRITIFAGGGDAFYARFQEFGTRKMTANPFFYVSYRANRRAARAGITRAMRKAIAETK